MIIVQAHTGAACVAVPERGIVFLDPLLCAEDAVGLAQAALPAVDRRLIERRVGALAWTEPAPEPRPTRPARRLRSRLASLSTTLLVGALALPLLAGLRAPVSAVQAWQNPVFTQLRKGGNWQCSPEGREGDLLGVCTATDGARMAVSTWDGPQSTSFHFAYGRHRLSVLALRSAGAIRKWEGLAGPTSIFPNLVVGQQWVMYGSDRERLQRWAKLARG